MSPNDAKNLADQLKSCFRTMSDAQQKAISRGFEAYEPGPVFDAIQEHVTNHEFVNGKDLFERIETMSSTQNRENRIRDLIADHAQKRREAEAESEDWSANHMSRTAEIEALIASMDDDGLKRAAAEAINGNSQLKAAGREWLLSCDPRKSSIVRAMIFDAFDKLGRQGAAIGVTTPAPTVAAKVTEFLAASAPDKDWENRW